MQNFSENISNKILFFFMPETITFFKALKNEDLNGTILKSICPYFYWCSAHEFQGFEPKNKFLFQYQVYSIENRKIVPGEVVQEWYENKNSIKLSVMNFIEKWDDHKRYIVGQYKDSKEKFISEDNKDDFFENKNLSQHGENSKDNLDNFINFAHFVGKSILHFQPIYIKECEEKNYDFLQKKFWESMATYYQSIIFNLNNQKFKQTKKTNKKLNKSVKNKNNETISNTRSK
jgi:hypothetical protein